jgi:hypothetical protein
VLKMINMIHNVISINLETSGVANETFLNKYNTPVAQQNLAGDSHFSGAGIKDGSTV